MHIYIYIYSCKCAVGVQLWVGEFFHGESQYFLLPTTPTRYCHIATRSETTGVLAEQTLKVLGKSAQQYVQGTDVFKGRKWSQLLWNQITFLCAISRSLGQTQMCRTREGEESQEISLLSLSANHCHWRLNAKTDTRNSPSSCPYGLVGPDHIFAFSFSYFKGLNHFSRSNCT